MAKKKKKDKKKKSKKGEAIVVREVIGTTSDKLTVKVESVSEGEERTTLSLSLTVGDKKALKMMAAEGETTIAAIIHEWVAEHARKD